MTGFLCAVGGVLLQNKSSSKAVVSESELKKTFVLSSSSQDVQYCLVTQLVAEYVERQM